MNETIRLLQNHRSVRAFQERPIPREMADEIIQCAMRAATAGAMMLYSIIEIEDQALKDKLAISCDHQPFIAKAPLVLLFLADYQRWFDLYVASGVAAFCAAQGVPLRTPAEGDLMLACCDALIAAQNAVVAAESLGLGTCYIGDILEKFEYHRELLHLPQYAFPVTMVCFGYPTPAAAERKLVVRFPQPSIHFKNAYQRQDAAVFEAAFPDGLRPEHYLHGATNLGQHAYVRKFAADFSIEMNRSVREAIRAWARPPD
jgi:FMN reductase (NADPH)/FMN reductase [NAD(P)H]